MKNNLKMLFLFMLLISSMIAISSNSWISSWFGLEMNMMSFIPLMHSNKNNYSNEAVMKYFIIQSIASSSFLFSNLINSTQQVFMILNPSNFMMNMILILPLMMKLGMAPFQSWFISVSDKISWNMCLLLFTWQKLAPMFLIFYLNKFSNLMMMIMIPSMISSTMGIFNQTSVRKILAYSSINHMSWMILSMMINKNMLTLYFFTYSLLTIPIILTCKMMNIHYLNNINLKSPFMMITMITSIFSLGGLPPFMGFLPKLMIIKQIMMTSQSFIFITTALIGSTLIILFMYIHTTYNLLSMNFSIQKWNINIQKSTKTKNLIINTMNVINWSGLILMYMI